MVYLQTSTYTITKSLLILIILLTALYLYLYHPIFLPPTCSPAAVDQENHILQPSPHNIGLRLQPDLRVTKFKALYHPSNSIFNSFLAPHKQHDAIFGHETHLPRFPILRGGLNGLYWLQHFITVEPLEPVSDRQDWILYNISPIVTLNSFDTADMIMTNPFTSLHVFLPPASDFQPFKSLVVIAMKYNKKTMSTGVFWTRVSAVSLKILSGTIMLMYIIGRALHSVLKQDGNKENIIWQPAEWYNGSISSTSSSSAAPAIFCAAVREARRVLQEAKDRIYTTEGGEWRDMIREVRDWMELRTWETEIINVRIGLLRDDLNLD
ncbi:glycosyltransferase family 34 protein [Plenodomus tracheiphilus IPT5]|uniref:Glycosyltransferase family 34 protein n=1 Tax=Plenodomus tracheiphilus IPT5 TaxID=1408161 RepID=A0A6A7AV04_9PLEO|nr:glycosyltransferase family 34 protein [Plenodomus tracheiphilus IPT5]